MKRSYIREILEATNETSISFAGGLPDSTLFDTEAFTKIALKTLQNPMNLQYSESKGLKCLRQKIAKRYCDQGFMTSTDQILITSGSQQALNIIALAFLDKGITLENPAYLGAIGVFNLHNIAMQYVTLKKDGIALKAFEQSIEKNRAAYLIPDFQNPTGRRYSLDKRVAIAEIIKDNKALIIEDAAYESLYFNHSISSISQMLPDHSFHIGSYSKMLAPGMRVGWIRTSSDKIEQMLPIKEALDLHTSTLNQAMISNYLEHFDLETRLQNIRNIYAKKMDFFAKQLETYLPEFEFEKPEGGMFIYGKLPGVDTKHLAKKCLEKNVFFVPGSEFYSNNGGEDEIRFNFTNSSNSDIKNGLETLGKLVVFIQNDHNQTQN